jgi:hypothetical protein
VALYFQNYLSKLNHMPNSANRSKTSNKNAGKGGPEHRTSRNHSEESNPERSDVKHEDHPKSHKGDTSRSSSQGRKAASGGDAED